MDWLIFFIGFFSGIFTYSVLSSFIGMGRIGLYIREVEKSALIMLASSAESIAFIQSIKYKTMKEMGISTDTIQSTKNIDDYNFSAWKNSAVSKLLAAGLYKGTQGVGMSEDIETNEKKEAATDDALSKLLMVGSPQEPEMRSMTIIGDINEDLSKDILAALWFLNHTAKREELVNPEDPSCEETKEVISPLEIIISTNGGNADEMFAIYDAMRYIRQTVDIETYGLGKVMSA